MPISADLIEILACPETKRPVHLADGAIIRRLGERAAAGTLRTVGGAVVADPPAEGLLTEDGRRLYPIRNDIPVMLVDQAIVVDEAEA